MAILTWNGVSWKLQGVVKTQDLGTVFVRSATAAWAGGMGGALLHWNGSAWNAVVLPTTGQFAGIFGVPLASTIWGLTNVATGGPISNEFLVSSDGASWPAMSNAPPAATYMKMWASGPAALWAVGWNSRLALWNGSSWAAHTSPVICNYSSVWGTGPKDVWAVGSGGTVAHYTGPLSSWTKETVPVTTNLLDVYGTTASDIWAVGEAGTILHYDGVRWRSEPSGTTETLWGVWTGY